MKHHKGILLSKLREVFSKKEEPGKTTVAKTYGGDESSFVETLNQELKGKGIVAGKKLSPRQKDLKRFGTSMGIIDVAEERPREYYRPKKLSELAKQQQDDLRRYGTPQGIIEVAEIDLVKKKREQEDRCTPSNRRFFGTKASDLKRFGTPEGLINVASGGAAKTKEKICKEDISPATANLYPEIYKEFSKAQVTIRNTTPNDKEITLWGAKPEIFSGEVNYQAVEQQAITTQVPSALHPQGMAHNPANHLVYAVNQLSGTVTIVNQQNQVVSTVQLQPSFPGLCSPVAICVNTSPASPHYGYSYIACSVSNTVQVISPAHEVVATIPVGCRPIAIAFNPLNNLVYVANLVDNTVSLIGAESLALISAPPLVAGEGPIGIGINPANGQVYICNSVSNTISVYSPDNNLISTINNTGQRPVSVTHNPANGFMYAVATNSNEVLKVNPLTHLIEANIPVGDKPYNSFFVSVNQFLYVQNRQDNTLTVIRPDNSLATISVGEQNIGSVFNPDNNSIYVSDTPNNRINVIGFGSAASGIIVSPDYTQIQADFKSNFAILQHVRFVVTGPERLYGFRLNRFNATGTTSTRKLSFENYASPAHSLNVSDFIALAGSMIDGRMNWKFMLPAYHTVSVLIWYRQFKVRELLPDLKTIPKTTKK